MPKHSKEPFKKGRRACIFCGGGPMSQEHIWPRWAHPILPRTGKHYRNTYLADRQRDTVEPERVLNRQGSIATIRIRCVCRSCNNGWMGTYEEDVRPFLEKMILGQTVILSPDNQKLLGEYLTYKMMVVDWDAEPHVVSDIHRQRFFEERTVPRNTEFFLFRAHNGPWSLNLVGQSVGLWPQGTVAPDPAFRNAKSLALTLGHLFIYCTTAPDADVDFGVSFEPGIALKIWPASDIDLRWPPLIALDRERAFKVAHALFRIDGASDQEPGKA